MNLENKPQKTPENQKVTSESRSKPQDKIGFQFSSAIKITDPNTKEVILHKRCS